MAESDYIDSLLSPILEKQVDDSDLWNILSGGGQPIVDAMLYMIPHTGTNQIRSLEIDLLTLSLQVWKCAMLTVLNRSKIEPTSSHF